MTQPSINWDHVAKHIVAMATDGDEETCMHIRVPIETDEWGWVGGLICDKAHHFASFVPGTCNWRDSLVIRPGYEEGKE